MAMAFRTTPSVAPLCRVRIRISTVFQISAMKTTMGTAFRLFRNRRVAIPTEIISRITSTRMTMAMAFQHRWKMRTPTSIIMRRPMLAPMPTVMAFQLISTPMTV